MRQMHVVRAWLRFVIVALAAGIVLAADAGEVVDLADSGPAGPGSDHFVLLRDLDSSAKTRYDTSPEEIERATRVAGTEPPEPEAMFAPSPMTARELIDLADVLYPSSSGRACELAGADSGRDYSGMSDSRIGHGGSRSRISVDQGYRMVMTGNGGMDLVRDIDFD